MRVLKGGKRAISRAAICGALMATVTATVFAPTLASAQTVGEVPYIDAVDDWADSQALRRTLPGSGGGNGITKPSKPKQGPQRPTRATARQLATLRFKRTEKVTQQNYQAVMNLLEPGYDPAAVVAEFDRLRAIAHKQMRGWVGRWSPNNIADVAVYWVLSCYGAFHARTSLPERPSLAVQAAARNGMALNRQVRRLSDARKQTAAEMLELRTIFRLSDVNLARMEGDAARERAAKAELRSWIRDAFGIDLERVKLTRQGLVRR